MDKAWKIASAIAGSFLLGCGVSVWLASNHTHTEYVQDKRYIDDIIDLKSDIRELRADIKELLQRVPRREP